MNKTLAGTFGFVLMLVGLGLSILGITLIPLFPWLVALIAYAGAYGFLQHAFSSSEHLKKQAEPSAPPNGGPATPNDNKGATSGPPSVS